MRCPATTAIPKALLLGVVCGFLPAGRSAEVAPPSRVLIVTGEDRYHDWQRTTPVLVNLLQRDPRLRVDVHDDLTALGNVDLSSFDVIVIHFKNEHPDVPGREAFDNLRQFVSDGGGLVVVHFGCGAFQEFKLEYARLIGRVWFGLRPPPGGRQHDPRGPFVVRISNTSHPITAGMSDFDTDDELYTCLEGQDPIEVIATAKSKVDRQVHPMAFLYASGSGRIFACTLGHDVRALRVAGTAKLYRRGCVWAAGREVTPQPPALPSQNEPSGAP